MSLRLVKNPSVSSRLITNQKGDYLWLTTKPTSRFQGWFLRFDENLYKIVDNLEVDGGRNYREEFSLARSKNVFLYKLNRPRLINVDLDLRKSYSTPERGRHYQVEKENDKLIVYYSYKPQNSTKLNADDRQNEDFQYNLPSCQKGEEDEEKKISDHLRSFQRSSALTLCVVFKFKTEPFFVELDRWIKRDYPFDQDRNSPPFNAYLYRPFKVRTGQMTVSVGATKNQAIKNLDDLKFGPKLVRSKKGVCSERQKDKKSKKPKTEDINFGQEKPAVKKAYQESVDSLSSLVVSEEDSSEEAGGGSFSSLVDDCSVFPGVYAGLPWFFQFWSRDELISLKALVSINPKHAFNILSSYLGSVRKDGRVANLRYGSTAGGVAESADAVGWLWLRAGEILSPRYPNLPSFSKLPVGRRLQEAITGLQKHHTDSQGFAVCGPQETWMDSLDRSGSRLELQALRLNMYRLCYEITFERKYKKAENELKQKVREHFWNGTYLEDGKQDPALRPNVFLAHYIYPQLLLEDEWRLCFDTALKHLWCNWRLPRNFTEGERGTSQQEKHRTLRKKGTEHYGKIPQGSASSVPQGSVIKKGGLATIDKNDERFCDTHTGQNPQSYHNGDSWFWVNNLAAVSMARLDYEHYKSYIKKIVNASTLDIIQGQIPGHCSELSSASSFSPAGSPVQAWSAATYIELVKEIKSRNFTELDHGTSRN